MINSSVQFQNSRVVQADFMPSSNFDERPDVDDISLLVIHNISLPPNDFESDDVIDFFLNRLDINKDPFYKEIKDLKVSSHFFIRRDGSLIQFVAVDKRAWHAGESEFKGRSVCNNFSIGIELEGADNIEYSFNQYQKLVYLTKAIMNKFPKIKKENIVGHSDIAPGRKTDPGPSFSWDTYFKLLSEMK